MLTVLSPKPRRCIDGPSTRPLKRSDSIGIGVARSMVTFSKGRVARSVSAIMQLTGDHMIAQWFHLASLTFILPKRHVIQNLSVRAALICAQELIELSEKPVYQG